MLYKVYKISFIHPEFNHEHVLFYKSKEEAELAISGLRKWNFEPSMEEAMLGA